MGDCVDPTNPPPATPSLEEEFLQEVKVDRIKSFFISNFKTSLLLLDFINSFFSTSATWIVGEMIITCREWLGASRRKNKKTASRFFILLSQPLDQDSTNTAHLQRPNRYYFSSSSLTPRRSSPGITVCLRCPRPAALP